MSGEAAAAEKLREKLAEIIDDSASEVEPSCLQSALLAHHTPAPQPPAFPFPSPLPNISAASGAAGADCEYAVAPPRAPKGGFPWGVCGCVLVIVALVAYIFFCQSRGARSRRPRRRKRREAVVSEGEEMSEDEEGEEGEEGDGAPPPPKMTRQPPANVARPKAVRPSERDAEAAEGSDDPMFQPLRRAVG